MTSPFQLYQYFVTLDDDAVGDDAAHAHLPRPRRDHSRSRAQLATDPAARAAQRRLAYEVVAFVHSRGRRRRGGRRLRGALRRVGGRPRPRDARGGDRRRAIDRGAAARSSQRASGSSSCWSRRACARRTARRAERSNREASTSTTGAPATPMPCVTEADLLHDRYVLLRRGKRHPHLVVVWMRRVRSHGGGRRGRLFAQAVRCRAAARPSRRRRRSPAGRARGPSSRARSTSSCDASRVHEADRGAPSGDARQHGLPRAATRTRTARTPTCSRPRTPSSPNLLSTALRRLRPGLGRSARTDAGSAATLGVVDRELARALGDLYRRGLPRGGSDRHRPRRCPGMP